MQYDDDDDDDDENTESSPEHQIWGQIHDRSLFCS